MEPQTTPPENQPIVVGGEPTPIPPSQVPPVGTSGGLKRKWLWLAVAVVVVVLAGGGFLLTKHSDTKTKQNQKQDQKIVTGPTAPDYGNIKVGSFRYVNACRALSAVDEQNLFAGISQTALLSATLAENTLPDSAIQNSQGKVTSSCSREFGSDTAYADTVVTFQVDQYPTVSAAQKGFANYGVSQAELDKANQQLGTNFSTKTAPLPGAKDTIYNPDINSSYTLDGNRIISFSALLAHVSVQQFQQAIIGALPTVLKNVNDNTLAQNLNPDPVYGGKIGDSTYMDPCKFYTDADFKAMTGGPNNPANVHFSYTYDSTTYFFSDISSGESNNDCTRYSYPGAKVGKSIKTEIQYFKTAADANQTIQQNFARLSGESGEKLQQVPGLGEYAYYRHTTDGSNLTYMDVQKGPYILEFVMNTSGTPSAADYTKIANVLLPKLK